MKRTVPKIAASAEQRRAIGVLAQSLVQAGRDAMGNVEDWWAVCERYHRGEWSSDDAPGEGLSPCPLPFSQPRQDGLTAQICNVLAKQDPYMLAQEAPAETRAALERTVHGFWRSAGFEREIRDACRICTDTNVVWHRLGWSRDRDRPFHGLQWEVIHPKHVVVFPATREGLEQARLIGHRFYRRLRVVQEMQKSGDYFADVTISAGDQPEERDTTGAIAASGATPSVSGPDPKDELVELWDLLIKIGEDGESEKRYRVTLAFRQAAVLQIEPYPYDRAWYFDTSLIASTEDGYWPAVSVARLLSGMQDAANKLSAAIYNGGMMSAFPPIFGPELPEKDFRYGFGDYIPTDMPAQNWSPTVSFRGEVLARMMEVIEEIGDRVARVSQNAQGALAGRNSTATEQSIVASGVQTGLEEYLSNFSDCLAGMAEFTVDLLRTHFSDWSAEADRMGIGLPQLEAPALWEANGKTPASTPQARVQSALTLLELVRTLGPLSGIDPYRLARFIVSNLELAGDGIQIDERQHQAIQAGNGHANPGLGASPGGGGGVAAPPGLAPFPSPPRPPGFPNPGRVPGFGPPDPSYRDRATPGTAPGDHPPSRHDARGPATPPGGDGRNRKHP